MLTPAPGTLCTARIDPDQPPASLNQAIKNSRAPFQMYKTCLADDRIRAQHQRQIGMLKIGDGMDEGTAVHNLCPGKFVVTVLATRGKNVSRAESSHKAEHSGYAQRVKSQRIAKVNTNRVGAISVENGLQAFGKKVQRLGPGDSLVAAICLPLPGIEQPVRMISHF